jgi:hypothetical protein
MQLDFYPLPYLQHACRKADPTIILQHKAGSNVDTTVPLNCWHNQINSKTCTITLASLLLVHKPFDIVEIYLSDVQEFLL